jgi:hypothetical protein
MIGNLMGIPHTDVEKQCHVWMWRKRDGFKEPNEQRNVKHEDTGGTGGICARHLCECVKL